MFGGDEDAWWRARIRDRKTDRAAAVKKMNPTQYGFSEAPSNALIAAHYVQTSDIHALDWDAPSALRVVWRQQLRMELV
jgi:hypothetical protein